MLFITRLLCGVALILLIGCESRPPLEQKLRDYVDALNRSDVIAVTMPSNLWSVLPFPERRERQASLSEFDIGLIDFLSVQDCDLGRIIGEKNSILGKVMPVSQRFLYEIALIRAIDDCSFTNETLQQEMFQVRKVKFEELPIAFSNSFWSGAESERFFSFSNGYISFSPERSGYNELRESLLYFRQLRERLDQVPKLESSNFEGHYQAIYESEYAGKLLLTIQLMTNYLNAVTEQIRQIDTNASFCGEPSRFLKQQFTVHYVDVLQPYMARVYRVAFDVLTQLDVLIRLTPNMSPTLREFLAQWSLDALDSPWSNYQKASRTHAQAWSQLFASCRMNIR